MAYGRLDVFWPDGKFETYLLDKPTMSVGRAGGCTIVLDTDTISRYHFSLTAQDDGTLEITDMDSANGTYVDGVRLANNETRLLQGGEEIQIGHLRMIYHRMDEQPTMPMDTLDEDTQRFVREDLGFQVDIYGPEIAVPPGSHTSIELAIYNKTDQPMTFTVKLSGLPEGWARINRPQLEVRPDDNSMVLINVKPFLHSDSKPGDYPVTITVAQKDNSDAVIEAATGVRILPFNGFGVALASQVITAHDMFHLHVHNQGSIGLPIFVMGRSKDGTLRFKLPQPQIVLAPGQRQVIKGEVLPVQRRYFGGDQEHDFDLMVRSRDEASFLAALPGRYVESALMPQWAMFATFSVLLAVGGLLLLALLLLSQVEPTPSIESFTVDGANFVRGESLTINWDVENADTVTVVVNSTPIVIDIPATDGSTQIDTDGFNGPLSIDLQAARGGRITTIEEPLIIELETPLVVAFFDVEPEAVARNVVQPITVRWRVEGATETQIQGLGLLDTNNIVQPSYGMEGEFEVRGLPTEPLTIILVAEDDLGNTLTESTDVPLYDPVCSTSEDNYVLYAEPREDANVISTLERGQTLVVDAQSQDNEWLRTVRTGVVAWGLREGLACDDVFDPGNLLVDPNTVPPPEATPEATPEIIDG